MLRTVLPIVKGFGGGSAAAQSMPNRASSSRRPMRVTVSTRLSRSCRQRDLPQGGAEGAGDMRAPLGPIETGEREAAAESSGDLHVDAERFERPAPRGRELVGAIAHELKARKSGRIEQRSFVARFRGGFVGFMAGLYGDDVARGAAVIPTIPARPVAVNSFRPRARSSPIAPRC